MKNLIMTTVISAFSMIVVSSFAQATIAPNVENVVGLTCDANLNNAGNGEDFGLAFTWSPFKGMFDTSNIEGDIEKIVESQTDRQTGETALFVKSKNGPGDLVEVLVFKTADMFNQLRFPARLYKGSMRFYSPKALKKTNCQAVNAIR